MNKNLIEEAISKLANAMRIYSEAHLKYAHLFKIDPEEAINNIDRLFEMKLEAFHTLYDVSKDVFKYFDYGDTALLILVRNAIHHRDHPLFYSLNWHLHLESGGKNWLGASFLLASHPTVHGGRLPMSHYVRLDDLDARIDPSLASPYIAKRSNKPEKAIEQFEVINSQLNLAKIRKRASEDRYPNDQIYLNLMPIFVSAICKVFKAMKAAEIGFKGLDAATYLRPFTTEISVDCSRLDFERLWFRGYGDLDLIPIPI